jgi:hypothetical protein
MTETSAPAAISAAPTGQKDLRRGERTVGGHQVRQHGQHDHLTSV